MYTFKPWCLFGLLRALFSLEVWSIYELLTLNYLPLQWTDIVEFKDRNSELAWIFISGLIFTTAFVVFITGKIAFIFILNPQFTYMILILFTDVYSSLNGFLTNQHNDQLPVGLLAQLIEHCIGIAEVMGSNPVQAWIFFRPYFHYCLVMFITAKIAFIYIHLLIRSLRI